MGGTPPKKKAAKTGISGAGVDLTSLSTMLAKKGIKKVKAKK